MKIYSKTRKSHYWNEDRFIVGKNYFVVIDGATPLNHVNLFNEACWLVNYIKKNFHRYKGCVKFKLSRLCHDAYIDLPSIKKEETCLPSASVCWVEFIDSKVIIGILGDCEVTAVYNDGRIVRYYDDKLNDLDKIATNEMIYIAKEKNIHITEARKFIQETLIKHRKLVNKPDGYNALVLTPNEKINEKRYEIDIDSLKTLYLYSDGFSQSFENLKIYATHEEMFAQIESIDKEIKKIVDVSFADAKCDRYPRFKKIDDITIIKIDL